MDTPSQKGLVLQLTGPLPLPWRGVTVFSHSEKPGIFRNKTWIFELGAQFNEIF